MSLTLRKELCIVDFRGRVVSKRFDAVFRGSVVSKELVSFVAEFRGSLVVKRFGVFVAAFRRTVQEIWRILLLTSGIVF